MDDLSNSWGCCLTVSDSSEIRRSRGTESAMDKPALNIFKESIRMHFNGKFVLTRIVSCGSDANLDAIISITGGDTNRCGIAVGSYVSGDNGILQSWSTCRYSTKEGPATISNPSEIENTFTKTHSIPLPYSIEGVMCPRELSIYENTCLKKIHLQCLYARLKGCAYKCILLELMLCGNGATLSDQALIMLGKLSVIHDFTFIVDEIMTGGRTGTMLLLETKPKAFVDRVSHVTLGKWLQAGLVLTEKRFVIDLIGDNKLLRHTTTRGTSTIGTKYDGF